MIVANTVIGSHWQESHNISTVLGDSLSRALVYVISLIFMYPLNIRYLWMRLAMQIRLLACISHLMLVD